MLKILKFTDPTFKTIIVSLMQVKDLDRWRTKSNCAASFDRLCMSPIPNLLIFSLACWLFSELAIF